MRAAGVGAGRLAQRRRARGSTSSHVRPEGGVWTWGPNQHAWPRTKGCPANHLTLASGQCDTEEGHSLLRPARRGCGPGPRCGDVASPGEGVRGCLAPGRSPGSDACRLLPCSRRSTPPRVQGAGCRVQGLPHATPWPQRPGGHGPCLSPGSRLQRHESPQSHCSFPRAAGEQAADSRGHDGGDGAPAPAARRPAPAPTHTPADGRSPPALLSPRAAGPERSLPGSDFVL